MTRGARSSEFIVTLLSMVCGVAMAFGGIDAGVIFAALSIPAAYVGGRSAVKAVRGENAQAENQ